MVLVKKSAKPAFDGTTANDITVSHIENHIHTSKVLEVHVKSDLVPAPVHEEKMIAFPNQIMKSGKKVI